MTPGVLSRGGLAPLLVWTLMEHGAGKLRSATNASLTALIVVLHKPLVVSTHA